jgi:hypothetical protein
VLAGKSTLFKQAISLYGEKPTHVELMQFVPIINSNIVQNIKTLVRWSDELRNPACPIAPENAGNRAKVDEARCGQSLPPRTANMYIVQFPPLTRNCFSGRIPAIVLLH